MANYVIGDLQGCLDSLDSLLESIQFSPAKDTLWLVGDLVNRGPKSLETLRKLISLGDAVKPVLGNHDLHLLALWAGHGRSHKSDTIEQVVHAPDAAELINWLRQQPLVRELPGPTENKKCLMVHAGILPHWTFDQALGYSREVQQVLAGENWLDFMAVLYGNKPKAWDENLSGFDRLRVIVNVCTRMRMLWSDGSIDYKFKLEPEIAPEGLQPWFEFQRKPREGQIIFGHWSTLKMITNRAGYCLDTGCVWGGMLTALRLEDEQIIQTPAVEESLSSL